MKVEHEQSRNDVEVRHPLVGIALAFVAGLWLSPSVAPSALPFVWVGALVLGVAACVMRRRAPASVLMLGAWLAAGVVRAALDAPGLSPREIGIGLRDGRGQMDLVVEIRDDPVLVARSAEGGRDRWEFEAEVEGARRSTPYWTRARGRIRVWMAAAPDLPGPAYGDRWRLSGVYRRDATAMICEALLEVRPGRGERLTTGGGHPLVRWCYERRRAARAVLHRGIERYPVEAAVQEALVVGYREGIPESVHADFQQTGTIHIFAISGLHVALMAGLLLAVLRAAGLSKPAWAWALVPMLTLYTLATGAAASAVRALVMASVYWSGHALRRRPDIGSSLALSALAILAVDPGQIREPGFIYSFAAVWGLIALTPVFMRPFESWLRRDPFEAGPEPRWRRAKRWAMEATAGMLATSAAAWLVSTPLTALYANQVAPVALLANLIAVPGSFLITLTGCLSLLFGSISDVLAEVFNHANRVFAVLMMAGVHEMFRIPWGHVFVCSPPLWAMGAWYAGLGGLLLLRGRLRLAVAGALVAVVAAASVRALTDRSTTVEFPAAGLAPAVFINAPGGAGDVLIDPGASWQTKRLVRWLHARGVDRLAAMVVTQPDGDHAGGAVALASRIPVGRVVCPASGSSPVYRESIAGLARLGLEVRPAGTGDTLRLAGGGRLLTAGPSVPAGRRAADAAIAVRIEAPYGGDAAWLAGPATPGLLRDVQTSALPGPARMLVVDDDHGLPGNDGWTSWTQPACIVVRRTSMDRQPEMVGSGGPRGCRVVAPDAVDGFRCPLRRMR